MEYQWLLDKIISCTDKEGVSDLLLSPNLPPAVRVNGDLRYVSEQKLSSEHIYELIILTMNEQQREFYKNNLEIDYAYDHESNKARFRVNAFNTIFGAATAMRRISSSIPEVEDVGAPDILIDLVKKDHGLILITGPTGSGKSTTLASMIQFINRNSNKHIITIEDPVEFIFDSDRSIINQRQLGNNTKSFLDALRSALREDPDVIMLGEMRDTETIRLALTAAETGHLVISTLHTNNAYESINRVIDVFPADSRKLAVSLLSTSLIGVVSQRLVKSKDGAGRLPVHEVLVATAAVKNLIREGNISQLFSMMQVGSKYGMVTLQDSLDSLISRGLVHSSVVHELISKADTIQD